VTCVQTLDLTHLTAEALLDQAFACSPPRLDLGALAVAALEHPELEPAPWLARLDGYAARVRARCALGTDPQAQLEALRQVLAVEEGFGGPETRRADPADSFLDVVLERKQGLPITLSVVWLEVARRADIPLYGLGFPGHFLVALGGPGGRRVVDPFGGGRELGPDDLSALLRRAIPNALVSEDLLAPSPVKAIVWRMLMNLKRLYFARGDQARALMVEDLLLRLSPDHPGELRARAALLSSLGAWRAALADVERVLHLGPAPDAAALQAAARSLRERVAYLH
jgi:regulator of sirC expression with transglutaminase-like and TPR domain